RWRRYGPGAWGMGWSRRAWSPWRAGSVARSASITASGSTGTIRKAPMIAPGRPGGRMGNDRQPPPSVGGGGSAGTVTGLPPVRAARATSSKNGAHPASRCSQDAPGEPFSPRRWTPMPRYRWTITASATTASLSTSQAPGSANGTSTSPSAIVTTPAGDITLKYSRCASRSSTAGCAGSASCQWPLPVTTPPRARARSRRGSSTRPLNQTAIAEMCDTFNQKYTDGSRGKTLTVDRAGQDAVRPADAHPRDLLLGSLPMSRFAPAVPVLLLASPLALAHDKGHGPPTLASAWTVSPWVLAPLLLLAGLYAAGLVRLWQRAGAGAGISAMQAAGFALGLAAMALATVWPLDALGEWSLAAHIAQHMLLLALVPPLLLAGRPAAAIAHVLPAT